MRRRGSARWVAVLGVLLFWSGVFSAGALVDGYSAREDYISSLASRGSPVALIGIGALLASAVAHGAVAGTVLSAWHARWCAAFVLTAGVASVVLALFRSSCPGGPAGCGVPGTVAGDWVDLVHALSVGVYQLFTVAAMLALAVGGLRRTAVRPRWLSLGSLGFAVGSVMLIGQTEGEHLGMWQRLWLANNLVWLLVVAWVSTLRRPAAGHE